MKKSFFVKLQSFEFFVSTFSLILILRSFHKWGILLHSSLKALDIGCMFISSSTLIHFMFYFFEDFLLPILVHTLFLLSHKHHGSHGFLGYANLSSLLGNTIFISFWTGLRPTNLQRFTSSAIMEVSNSSQLKGVEDCNARN